MVKKAAGRGCTVKLCRDDGVEGFFSTQRLSTDALNAMSAIPGVSKPEILSETDELVTISYIWTGPERCLEAGDILRRHGVAFAELK